VQQIRDAWTAPDVVNVNFCAEWSILKFQMSKGARRCTSTNTGSGAPAHHHVQYDRGNLYAQWDPDHEHFLRLCQAYSSADSESWPLLYSVQFYCPGKGSNCGTYEPTNAPGQRSSKRCQGGVQLHMRVFVKPASNPPADQTWQQLTVVSLGLSSKFEQGRHVAVPEKLHLAFGNSQAEALEALIHERGKRLEIEQEIQSAPFRAVIGEGPIRPPICDFIFQVAEDFTPSSIHAHLHARSLQLLGDTNLKHRMNVNHFPHLHQIQRLVDNVRRKKKAARNNVDTSDKPAMVRHPLRKKAAWPVELQLQDISVAEVDMIIGLLNLQAADEVSIAQAHQAENDWAVLFSSKAMAKVAAEYGTKIIGLDFVWKIGTYKTLSEVAEAILAKEQNVQQHFLHWMMRSVKLNSNTGLLKDVKLGLAVLVVHVPSDRMHSDANHMEAKGSGDGKTFIAGIALCSAESKSVCTFLIQQLRSHVSTFILESIQELHAIQELRSKTSFDILFGDISHQQAKDLCFPVLRLCCRNPLMYSCLDEMGDTQAPTGMRLMFLVESLAHFCVGLRCEGGCQHNDMLFECHLLCKHVFFLQIVSCVHMEIAKLAEVQLKLVTSWEPALAIDEGKGARWACETLKIKWLFCEWHLWYNWGQELDIMEMAMLKEEQQETSAVATTLAEVQNCIRRCVQRVRTLQEAQDCAKKFDEAMLLIVFHARHGIGSAAVLAFKKYFAAKLQDVNWIRAVSDWGRLEVGVMRSKLGHTNMLSESVVRKLSAQVMNGRRSNLNWPSMLVFSNLVLQMEDIQSTWHQVGMQQEGSLSADILRVRRQDVMARSLCYGDRVKAVTEFDALQTPARGYVTSLAGARVRVWWSNEQKWYGGWLGLRQQSDMTFGDIYNVAYDDGTFMAVMYPDVHGFVQVLSVPGEEHHLDVLEAVFDFPIDATLASRFCLRVAKVFPFAPNCGEGDAYLVTMQHPFCAFGATCTCLWFVRTGKSDCKHVGAVMYRNQGAPVLKPGVNLEQHRVAAIQLYQQQAGHDQWTVAGVFARKPIDTTEQPAISYRVSYVGCSITQWVPAAEVGDMAIINKYPADLAFRVALGTASASVTAMNRAKSNKRGLKNKPTRKSKKSHKHRDFT
jgi:hypothetical protein